MRERPIIFSSAMVNAILSGAKTQTRRMRGLECVNENPNDWAIVRRMEKIEPSIDGEPQEFPGADDNSWLALKDERGIADLGFNCLSCPFGIVGDRLWVREKFIQGWPAPDGDRQDTDELGNDLPMQTWYAADDDAPALWLRDDDSFTDRLPWKPSIFMPRSLSRITLEITGVRVERLNEISEQDVCAEGLGSPITRDYKRPKFIELWNKINGKKHPWASNPFVWVIEFKRLEQK